MSTGFDITGSRAIGFLCVRVGGYSLYECVHVCVCVCTYVHVFVGARGRVNGCMYGQI